MTTWTLVLFIYAGALAKGDSVAITNVPHFQSRGACEAAGAAMKPLVTSTFKELRFACVRTTEA